jgi:flagellar biosynthesis/type III secretory pathway chaperone
MTQQPQARQAPPPRPPIATPADARKLAEEMVDVMTKLLAVVEQETELVRAGKVRDAMQLEQQKTALTGRYVTAVETLRTAQKHLAQVAPDLLATLKRHHETFRAMLQINLTVLATAHAVSEGIVRGVNAEVQRRNMPNAYTAAGQRAAPSPRQVRPLAVSRSL